MITVSLPLYLLVIANAALIVAAAFAVMRVERAVNEPREFWASPTGLAMRGHLQDGAEDPQLRQSIAALQGAVARLQEQAPAGALERVLDPSLGRAVRLAKHGASVEDLIGDCGLNRGEAELLHRLHATKTALQAAGVKRRE